MPDKAKRIAISFPESAKYFPADKTAFTGNPIRKEILGFTPEEAKYTLVRQEKEWRNR